MMNYVHEITDNVLFLHLEGDLLGENKESEIIDLVKEQTTNSVTNCIVDISKIGYMNSTGLSFLIRLLTRFRNAGGELVLLNPSEQAQKLLVITKLNNIFSVANSKEEALKELQS